LEKLGFSLAYLVSQIINFALLTALLYLLLYKPVLNMMQKRQDRIAHSLADVDTAREKAAQAQREYDRLIVEAQRKAQEIVSQAAGTGEKAGAEIKAEAQREAEAIRQRAHQEAAEERARILADVQSQIASLSMLATERVLGQGLDEKMQRQLIDQSMLELGALQPSNGGAKPRQDA
jgi:F-type H+-transporting ATPase subunit b